MGKVIRSLNDNDAINNSVLTWTSKFSFDDQGRKTSASKLIKKVLDS